MKRRMMNEWARQYDSHALDTNRKVDSFFPRLEQPSPGYIYTPSQAIQAKVPEQISSRPGLLV